MVNKEEMIDTDKLVRMLDECRVSISIHKSEQSRANIERSRRNIQHLLDNYLSFLPDGAEEELKLALSKLDSLYKSLEKGETRGHAKRVNEPLMRIRSRITVFRF